MEIYGAFLNFPRKYLSTIIYTVKAKTEFRNHEDLCFCQHKCCELKWNQLETKNT